MAIERHAIKVRDISVEVVRKDIKNLHVGVYPPNGRVRVAAPRRLDDEAVRLAVISRLGWIRRQQKDFDQQIRQSRREMVTGESHYYQGRRYLLDVVEHDGPASVDIVNNTTKKSFGDALARIGWEEGRTAKIRFWRDRQLLDAGNETYSYENEESPWSNPPYFLLANVG